mgnify:CR=1 FL=1
MRPEIEEKPEIVFIRKTLRVDNNPLLEGIKEVVFLGGEYEFQGFPFKNCSHSNYKSFYQDTVKRLISNLEKKDIKTNIFNSIEDLEAYVQHKQVRMEKLSGEYESHLENRLNKVCDIEFIKNTNYLLNDEDNVLEKSKNKMGFSFFRKKFEKLAIVRNNHFEENTSDNESLQAYKDYLNSKAPLTYFETRNAFIGDNFSTRLSDKLNLGQISPQSVISLLENFESEYGSNKSTYWIKFELLWREYFYWLYQVHFEEFFQSQGLNGGGFSLPMIDENEYLEKMNTHELIECMNKELMQTGFLSNRSRQIYVSYLVHGTDLDWRYGAWFFQNYLKDYDLYSNWGNWLYGSGYGTDARGPRYFKISKQLKQYDSDNKYLEYWKKR